MLKSIKYLLIFHILISTYVGYSQSRKIDSLIVLLKKDIEDTTKVSHLNALGWELKNSNPDTAIILGNQAVSLGNIILGEVKDLPQTKSIKKIIANSLGKLGVYHWLKADYYMALETYLKALKLDEELNDKTGMAKRLGNIGLVYWNQGDYPKALDYYVKALKMAEELGDKFGIAADLSNIGLIYSDQGDHSKALDHYLRALKIDEELKNKNGIAIKLGNIGIVYYSFADYPKALGYFFRALEINEELENKNGMAIILGNIGSVYAKQNNHKEAETYLLKALSISDSIGALNEKMQFETSISELYIAMDEYKKALEHYKTGRTLKDTLFSQEKNKELTQKQMNYDFDRKEAAAKAEQDKKDAVTKIIIYSVSVGFLLVLLLSVFIFRGYRQKQKANIIISEQKLLVEEKQKAILDSIRYAKRIQQSLMPHEKYLEKKIKELKG